MTQEKGSSRATHLVLVVDADDDIRQAVAEVLQDFGCTAVLFSDGAAALAWLGESPAPSALLVEVADPRTTTSRTLSGSEFLEQLATLRPSLLATTILTFVSRSTRDKFMVASVAVAGSLMKPFGVDELQQAISRARMML